MEEDEYIDDVHDDSDGDVVDEEGMDLDIATQVVEEERTSLFAPPTSSEYRQLKESQQLFKSNLFKLQIEELLQEVTCKTSKSLQAALFAIKETIEVAPDCAAVSLSEAEKKFDNIRIPFNPAPASDSQIKFAYQTPDKISIVGSFLLGAIAKQPEGQNIDIALIMPSELFQDKDHMNHRYFHKRAFYLSYVTFILQQKFGSQYTYNFEAFLNDVKRPILVLESTKENPYNFSKRGYRVRIHLQVSSDLFMLSRLAPSRNCVRSIENEATSVYNASLMQESLMLSHLNLINTQITECPQMKDAVLLLKVWIAQRKLSGRVGYGLNGYLVTMIIVFLTRVNSGLKYNKIGKRFSSYQIFKVVIDFLATMNIHEPLFLNSTGKESGIEGFSSEAFQENYEVSIVDPLGTTNLASMMSLSAMEEIQYEAQLTSRFLSDSTSDRFEDIFLKKVHQEWLKYDNVFRIPVLEGTLQGLYSILRRGLTDRVKFISISIPTLPSWKVCSSSPAEGICDVMIGMVLDGELSLREVEHGPNSIEVEKVRDFKQLWGSRSELRRFQDGTIQECVVFECDSSVEQRALLVARMTAYLLQRHYTVGEDDGVTYWAGLGYKYLKGHKQSFNSFQPLQDAFMGLSKLLRSLDLPLSVYKVSPNCDQLSFSSVFIPQQMLPLTSKADPVDILVEFETSAKWPEEVGAIETLKRAFYIKIVSLLNTPDAVIGIGEGNEAYLNLTFDGFLFKAKIHHPRVRQLLVDGTAYEKEFIHLPVHTARINNLCLRYPFLGPSIRLAKRWLSSHLLLDGQGISKEIVELICVRVYTNPSAFGSPSSAWTGFVRFLHLFKSFKWNEEPFIVELEPEKLTLKDRDVIRKNFDLVQNALFVASEVDLDSTWWGSANISHKVVERIVNLSTVCLGLVKNQLLNGTNNDISQLFITPVAGYNVVIHLDASKLFKYFNNISFDSKKGPALSSQFKNLVNKEDKELMLLATVDPMKLYLSELIAKFGEIAYFFADVNGGDKIALVWKNNVLGDTAFKVALNYNAMDSKLKNEKGNNMVTVNKVALVAEMQRLGDGLVVGVDFQ